MKQVVYLLGAGFSQPLGLPVMMDFLDKAKDLYYGSESELDYFRPVLDTISGLHVASAYYNTDLFNIEQVLSILDMRARLAGDQTSADFTRFIKEVIGRYTPPLPASPAPNRWQELLFYDRPWVEYSAFIAALLGYQITKTKAFDPNAIAPGGYKVHLKKQRSVAYSVITLNYDLVLELVADALAQRYHGPRFARTPGQEGPRLAKLHGSIDAAELIPPISIKILERGPIRDTWRAAYELLKGANEIRIIGYSLPESDAYVRYLLRAAVIDTPNPKRIHVLSLDDKDGTTERRYREFISFRGFRFTPTNTSMYLARFSDNWGQWPDSLDPDVLETVHSGFFGS